MRPTDDQSHPTPARDSAEYEDSDAATDFVATSLKLGPTAGGEVRGDLAVLDQRLSRGAKLRRAAVVVLAVVLALAVIFGGRLPTPFSFFASISHALTPRQPAALPIPTARALTARPPVPLAASPWQEIRLPTSHDMVWSFAPVPSDPSTVYACANSAHFKDNPATLWRSRDAGNHWQQMPVLFSNDTGCWVQVADDGLGHVSVLVEGGSTESFIGRGCELSALYLSRDNGATWNTLDPGAPFPLVEPNSLCSLTLTPHHLYAFHYYSFQSDSATHVQQQAFLMRSDDGRTWTAADADIGAFNYFGVQFVPERDDDTLLANVSYQSGDEAGTTLWRSSDAGRHWRSMGKVVGFSELMVSQEPVTTRTTLASRILYGLVANRAPEELYYMRAIESSDGQHWEKLPPLPVPGAAPDRVGVREALGVAAGGKLLFLGVDPRAGVPATGGSYDDATSGEQWLWVWDPLAQRWEVPQTPLRAAKGFSCSDHCWDPHLTWGASPDGTGYGTYVWVLRWGDISKGATTRLYRTFIPASR